jgi:hypothetical protein
VPNSTEVLLPLALLKCGLILALAMWQCGRYLTEERYLYWIFRIIASKAF